MTCQQLPIPPLSVVREMLPHFYGLCSLSTKRVDAGASRRRVSGGLVVVVAWSRARLVRLKVT